MRNNPGKNSSGSVQAELTVAGNAQHFRKLRALGLGGGYRRNCSDIYRNCSDIYLRVGFTHAMMLTVPAATGGEGILSRRKEGRCHGQAHDNGQ